MPTTFANTIDNNEILAKRSQCDYAGNDIQTTYATKTEVTTGLAGKENTISDLATIRSGAAAGSTAVQPGDLATVATTGAYSDLTGTPTIPPALSAGNGIDITNNVVSADLDGTSLTNGANGLSVTLPVPDTTGASQGDVLSVGQDGIEWVTPGGGGGDDSVLTYNVSTWSDFTTAYNAGKNIRVVETVDGATHEAVLFEYNPNGSPYGYAKFTATILRNGVGAVSSNWYQISNIGSGVWTRGAGTIQGNFSGQGAISVNSASHVISLTLDGSSLTQSSSGLAVANPLPSTLGTAGQVLQVNSGATGVEWATPAAGGVTDVEVDGTSVVSGGVASITMPTVDQTYDASSTNPQSGTAVAGAISGLSQVPPVTSSDNNKVLKASYSGGVGSYAWASESDDVEIVSSTLSASDAATAIATALNNNRLVLYRYDDGQSTQVDLPLVYYPSSNATTYTFAGWVSDTRMFKRTLAYADNAWSWSALTKRTIPAYTAGNMISLANSAIAVSTTAGITDIQQVSALPANPVATVLYLIPET